METKQTKLKQFLDKNGEIILYTIYLLLLGFALSVLMKPLFSFEYLRENFLFYQEIGVLAKYLIAVISIFLFFSVVLGILLNKLREQLGILTRKEKELKELQECYKKLEKMLSDKK